MILSCCPSTGTDKNTNTVTAYIKRYEHEYGSSLACQTVEPVVRYLRIRETRLVLPVGRMVRGGSVSKHAGLFHLPRDWKRRHRGPSTDYSWLLRAVVLAATLARCRSCSVSVEWCRVTKNSSVLPHLVQSRRRRRCS
jgi:hypothetical protein